MLPLFRQTNCNFSRPSQGFSHSYAIDFFAWPGVRERFVFSQHRYCTNIFWHLFCGSLRVLWQYEFRDCYTRNMQTGEYKMSSPFLDRISDINSWAMTNEIFQRWPELYSDIPSFNQIPASLSSHALLPKAIAPSVSEMPTPASTTVARTADAEKQPDDDFNSRWPAEAWHVGLDTLQYPEKGLELDGLGHYPGLDMNTILY